MRDSRRRRMMFRDEQDVDESNEFSPSSEPGYTRSASDEDGCPEYTAGARVENQPKLIDFVPTKAFTITGIFVMLASVIALLNIAHFKILPFANAKGISAGALELSLDQGLLSWVASFLLLATAFFCFQVFQVRRYRADDFTGSYRVWVWMAIGFVIASIDATARISPVVASLISANWESGLLANDRNVWLFMVGLPAGFVCFRLITEIWRSRIAIGTIAVASLAYAMANILRFDMLPSGEANASVVQANTVVVAHSFLFFTIVWYSRYVLLESQGLIAVELPVEEAEEESTAEEPVVGKVQAKTPSKKVRAKKTAEPESTEEVASVSIDEAPKLKLMGQSVTQKKNNKKKKGQQTRRAA